MELRAHGGGLFEASRRRHPIAHLLWFLCRRQVLHGLAGKLAAWVDLHDAFKAMDENRDGTLSVAELKSGVGKLLERDVSESAIQEIFTLIDKDHDGKVSYTDFIALAETQHTSTSSSSSSFPLFRPTEGVCNAPLTLSTHPT